MSAGRLFAATRAARCRTMAGWLAGWLVGGWSEAKRRGRTLQQRLWGEAGRLAPPVTCLRQRRHCITQRQRARQQAAAGRRFVVAPQAAAFYPALTLLTSLNELIHLTPPLPPSLPPFPPMNEPVHTPTPVRRPSSVECSNVCSNVPNACM